MILMHADRWRASADFDYNFESFAKRQILNRHRKVIHFPALVKAGAWDGIYQILKISTSGGASSLRIQRIRRWSVSVFWALAAFALSEIETVPTEEKITAINSMQFSEVQVATKWTCTHILSYPWLGKSGAPWCPQVMVDPDSNIEK
jgi:hypothetical protein